MPRPLEALIHLDSLRHNLQRARECAPDARVWSVVKANAYGHGLRRVYEALRSTDGFALLDIAEAQRLREMDWRGPILLLEGVFEARDLEWCSRLNLWHVVHRNEQIDWIAQHKTEWPHRVFLKMNTGMNRLGFRPEAFRSAWARLSALSQVDEVSLITHFSDADSPRGIAHQVAAFHEFTADLSGERSLCNSAATLRHAHDPLVRGDWIRPGVMLYGASPDYPEHDAGHWGLQAAMTLRSRLIATQNLRAGDTVGYGSRFTAPRDMRIGVVACGYADGYPRHAPDGTPVLVNGIKVPIVGRVSMDMLEVDLSLVPDADIGSEVTLWGKGPTVAGHPTRLPIDEVALHCGTIGYELMCALSPRVAIEVMDSASA
ncbi:MAG: alanine racemase [Burkholderiales bacterium]|nr:alanine racemase [Burkholderiales bacterium]